MSDNLINEKVEKLYYDLIVPFSVLEFLSENSKEYYDILKSIQTELRVKDTSIASPNYVNVNLATRTIDLSSGGYKDFLSVEKDHRAETIYFEVPRFFDDVDLTSKNIIIEYQNKDGN